MLFFQYFSLLDLMVSLGNNTDGPASGVIGAHHLHRGVFSTMSESWARLSINCIDLNLRNKQCAVYLLAPFFHQEFKRLFEKMKAMFLDITHCIRQYTDVTVDVFLVLGIPQVAPGKIKGSFLSQMSCAWRNVRQVAGQ